MCFRRMSVGRVLSTCEEAQRPTAVHTSIATMEFISRGYTALRGPGGQPQDALETIIKLSDRLTQATLISDRRAAVLGLKGLTRDCKADVGQYALDPLLALLDTDAKDDLDAGKAILETLLLLCHVEVKEGSKIPRDDLGLRHTDVALAVSSP